MQGILTVWMGFTENDITRQIFFIFTARRTVARSGSLKKTSFVLAAWRRLTKKYSLDN